MISGRILPLAILVAWLPVVSFGQDWPTYNGDYTGRRFSSLSQINSSNVNSLAIAWTFRTKVGAMRGVGLPEIKSTPLEVNGILYFTLPDHVWAVDARTGEELWH